MQMNPWEDIQFKVALDKGPLLRNITRLKNLVVLEEEETECFEREGIGGVRVNTGE